MATRYLRRHEEIAECIIKTDGLVFALAASAGKDGDMRMARDNLKVSICVALAKEAARPRTETTLNGVSETKGPRG